MKVTLNKTENRTAYLTVEIEPKEIDEYMEKVYQRLVKTTDIPSFNKGSAPRDALEKHVGRDKMIEEAMKEMESSVFPIIIKEQKLEAIMQPMVRVKQNEPPVFEMVVPLKPLVKLGNYHNMCIEPDSLEVSKKEVDTVLEGLRKQFAEHNIQAIALPELNDEFANKVAPGIKTMDLLKDRIKKNMRLEREQNAKSRFEEKVVESLIEISKLEYPPLVIDMEAQHLLNKSLQQIRASCKDETEYEAKLRQMPEDIIKERVMTLAKKRALWSLILNEVAKIENIEVDDKEINEEIEHMVSGSDKEKKEQREYLNDYYNRQNVYDLVKARKTIDRLVEIVKTSNI